jgi:hypothetical protein
MTIEIKSHEFTVNEVTYQPKLHLNFTLSLTLEFLQEYNANSIDIRSESHSAIGNELMDAVVSYIKEHGPFLGKSS